MTKNKKITIIAIAVIMILLLGSVAAIVFMQLNREEGAIAVVRIDGVEVARYSLMQDGTYELNGGTNILVIQGGRAWMQEADCPDKVCVQMGPVGYNGQCITCLPNRVTVTIEDETSEIDIAL